MKQSDPVRLRRRRIARFVALATAASLVAGLFFTTFDLGSYRGEAARLLGETVRRPAHIDGGLSARLLPRIDGGLDATVDIELGALRLSEAAGEADFATVETARLRVRLLPLIFRRIEIERLETAGLRVALLRQADGRLNIDDLIGAGKDAGRGARQEQPGETGAWTVSVAELVLRDAAIAWRDEQTGARHALRDVTLRAGELSFGTSAPASGKLDLAARLSDEAGAGETRLTLAADYRYDPGRREAVLQQLDVRLADMASFDAHLVSPLLTLADGRLAVPGMRLDARRAAGAWTMLAGADLAGIAADRQGLHADRLALEWTLRDGRQSFAGRIASPLAVVFAARQLALPALDGAFDLEFPQLPAPYRHPALRGALRADLAGPALALDLDATVPGSRLRSRWEMTRLAPPRLDFFIDIDRLSLDRIPAGTAEKGDFAAALPAGSTAGGTIRIDRLRLADTTLRQVELLLRLDDSGWRVGTAPRRRRRRQSLVRSGANVPN